MIYIARPPTDPLEPCSAGIAAQLQWLLRTLRQPSNCSTSEAWESTAKQELILQQNKEQLWRPGQKCSCADNPKQAENKPEGYTVMQGSFIWGGGPDSRGMSGRLVSVFSWPAASDVRTMTSPGAPSLAQGTAAAKCHPL